VTERFEIDGRTVELSRPEKVLFPKVGIRKRDLFEYYRRIFTVMSPHVRGRPITVERHPDGIEAAGFFQKNVPRSYPDWIERETLTAKESPVEYLLIEHESTLAYLADQACTVLHAGLGRVAQPDRPDRLVFDLDPSDDRDLAGVRLAATALRRHLERAGLVPFVLSSGSRGAHIVCPLEPTTPFDDVRAFAKAMAEAVAAESPEQLTTEVRKAARKGRVFIDVLRNAYGQTSVVPYSVRATPNASIATPLDWREFEDAAWHPRRTTMKNLFRRLGQKADPWQHIDDVRRPLAGC